MATQADLTALEQIKFARWYTTELLGDIDQSQWFLMPGGSSTHVAWQVGHLAFAQHAMCILRLRDAREDDERLLPVTLRQLFGRNGAPVADPALYSATSEIRALFEGVHEQILQELAVVDPATLDEHSAKPHRFAKTKLDCLTWCSQHELVHAGQIALLRRMLGKQPQW